MFSLRFLHKHEHVLLVGPDGVGKSFISQYLGYAAIMAGYTARFLHADNSFRIMAQAKVGNSVGRTFCFFFCLDLFILDDLEPFYQVSLQSADLYQLIIGRHWVSSFVITSNRTAKEWLGLFDDSIVGSSVLNRLANAT